MLWTKQGSNFCFRQTVEYEETDESNYSFSIARASFSSPETLPLDRYVVRRFNFLRADESTMQTRQLLRAAKIVYELHMYCPSINNKTVSDTTCNCHVYYLISLNKINTFGFSSFFNKCIACYIYVGEGGQVKVCLGHNIPLHQP